MGPDLAVVEIRNDGFHPLTALIRLGGTVRWVNKDTVSHTVHFPGSPDGETAPIPPGSWVEVGFKGSTNYYATDHPSWTGTVGVVGTERRADGLIYPLNYDHQVNFGSPGKADGDYQKGPSAPPFVTSPAWAWTTMVQPLVATDGTITLLVDKAQSWVDARIDDPLQRTPDASGTSPHERLRRHEQVHFDLTALLLRDFLNGGGSPDQAGLDKFYEADTGEGSHPDRQQQWVDQINAVKIRPVTDSIDTLWTWARSLNGGRPRP